MRIAIALCGACGATRPEGLFRLTERGEVELWWMEDLCSDPASLARAVTSGVEYLIVLGPSDPKDREILAEAARTAGLHPFNLDFLDIPLPATQTACEAVLRGGLAAVHDGRTIDERHAKSTNRVRGLVTRRTFLRGMRPSWTISIPRVRSDGCRAATGCNLCVPACGAKALEIRGGSVRLDPASCTGCDRCVAACPVDAMVNPVAGYGRQRERIRAWVEATRIRPRRLALACTPSALASLRALRRWKATGFVFQEIPCLGALRPHEYLDILALGIDQIILSRQPGSCEDLQRCTDPVPSVLGVLSELPELEGRIVEVEVSDLPRVLRKPPPEAARGRDGEAFASLFDAVRWFAGAHAYPIPTQGRGAGFVEIRPDRCTGCLVCRDRCPTDAIEAAEEPDVVRIAFRHERCDACGLCESACPEEAIVLRHEIRLDQSGSKTLFSDEWAMCRVCGSRVGPRRMLDELAARIGMSPTALELCPDCKMKALGRDPLARSQARRTFDAP